MVILVDLANSTQMPLNGNHSLTTGFRVLGKKHVRAYSLEYLTPCELHPKGSYDTIVVPVIELGRDSSCTIYFGKDWETVSRKHALIEMQEEDIIIRNLSQTNPTFVNGQTVQSAFYLQNGDIIQLSAEGPRLRFNIPDTEIMSLAFTRRMHLLVQQSVRPYRKALIAVGFLTVLLGILGGSLVVRQMHISKGLLAQSESQAMQIHRQDSIMTIQDSLVRALDSIAVANEQIRKSDSTRYARLLRQTAKRMVRNKEQLSSVLQDNQRLQQTISSQNRKIKHLEVQFRQPLASQTSSHEHAAAIYDQFRDHIYFLKVLNFHIKMPDGTGGNLDISWNGTGFLLEDGKFVTARHCIQGWRFVTPEGNEEHLLANMAEQMGAQITVHFEAISPSGHSFSFTNQQVRLDDRFDRLEQIQGPGGKEVQIKIANPDQTDWAYVKRPGRSSLQSNLKLSRNLRAATPVYILGYSYGNALQKSHQVDPLFSESKIARNGLSRGLITLTDRNFGQGNSGGPVLAHDASGNPQVVGIVSAGLGSEIGIVVPISAVR